MKWFLLTLLFFPFLYSLWLLLRLIWLFICLFLGYLQFLVFGFVLHCYFLLFTVDFVIYLVISWLFTISGFGFCTPLLFTLLFSCYLYHYVLTIHVIVFGHLNCCFFGHSHFICSFSDIAAISWALSICLRLRHFVGTNYY